MNDSPKLQCPCGATARADKARGWLNETWPTLGGDKIRVVSCLPCRRLTSHFDGDAICDGRCGGHNDSAMACQADCVTCQDRAYEQWDPDAEPEPRPVAGTDAWACWSQGCVRAWAATHSTCNVQFTPGRAAA